MTISKLLFNALKYSPRVCVNYLRDVHRISGILAFNPGAYEPVVFSAKVLFLHFLRAKGEPGAHGS